MRLRTLSLAFSAALVLGAAAGVIPNPAAPAAQAQNLGERTVSGTVLGPNSAPVSGATVYLKNQKTKDIRSFTSLQNGHFHFAQVNKAIDYDLWAEKNGKRSTVKTVSSWDSRTNFITDLKLK